ncbi:MAG: apolipoprotein N-acyltransferase [Undibacterium sp.]|nr:apolipoprotein N-acyltransferase [Undibacterium sp.]
MLVASLLGALNVLSFAPFFIWPLQMISSAAMFFLLVQHRHWNKKQCFFLGFSYAFSTLFLGISWLSIAMARYGGMPWVLSLLAVALLAAFLALFYACAFGLAKWIKERRDTSDQVMLLLLLPSLFLLCEYLRAYVFTGFPWLSTGYAHQVSSLAGFAPVLGVIGVGGVSALTAGAVALAATARYWRWRMLALILGCFAFGFGLQQIAWTSPVGQSLTVRLIQGNVDQGEKFDRAFVERQLQQYATLLQQKPADIIAIPETALPIPTSQLPATFLSDLQHFALSNDSHLALGVVVEDVTQTGVQTYTNSLIGLGKEQQNASYRYDKHHLVPFGEFVPYGFRWFVNMLQIPLGELASPGVQQAAMQVKDQRVMPNICYEDLFGMEIAAQLRAQAATKVGAASILLNISNLAWYGDSIAIDQHLQIAQMRTLETGRPMLRSTNTGATAIISAQGKVQAQLPRLMQGSLDGHVQGMQGLTPYIRFGDLTGILLGISALLVAWYLSAGAKASNLLHTQAQ